jgi:uncharacterized membrane protein
MRHGALGSVVRVGLIAGTLDITENLIFNAFRHITPVMIFQYIASGLTGRWAFGAGMASVLLGVAIHYTIAFFWTAVYWVASRRMGVLIGRPVVCGLVYGAVVYLIMNFVVLPLTRVPHSRTATTVASRVSGVLALLFCVGVTVAVLTARERMQKTTADPSTRYARTG